jgi:hypothetical protein
MKTIHDTDTHQESVYGTRPSRGVSVLMAVAPRSSRP